MEEAPKVEQEPNKIEQIYDSLKEIEDSVFRLNTLAVNSLSLEKQNELISGLDKINMEFEQLEQGVGLRKNEGRQTMRGFKNR